MRTYDAANDIKIVYSLLIRGVQLPNANAGFSISHTKKMLVICGTVDDVSEDGVATIRVGKSIFLVETQGSPFQQGIAVELQAAEVYLFDTGVL